MKIASLLVMLLVIFMSLPGVFAQPPGWTPPVEVDVAKYLLLKADVPAKWTWMSPEVTEEAQGSGMQVDGRIESMSYWRLVTQQDLEIPVKIGETEAHVAFHITGTIAKSPLVMNDSWERFLSNNVIPLNLPEDMQVNWSMRPTAETIGAASVQGHLGSRPVGVFSFKHGSYTGSVAAQLYYFDKPEVISMARQVTAMLAAKIANAPLPVVNELDIAILPSNIFPSVHTSTKFAGVEKSADKHRVCANVSNLSTKIIGKNIMVQLWLGQPGYEGSYAVGDPVKIETLDPQKVKTVTLEWPLTGPVEKTPLYVMAVPTEQEDADTSNNYSGIEVSVYYATNGARGYSLVDDGYSFANWGFEDGDVKELIEGFLSSVVGHMYDDPKICEVMTRLLYPQTYSRLYDYLTATTTTGSGGHCYGMSATSALYFQDPSLRPEGARTADMTMKQASFNINIYHRAQMNSLFSSVLSGRFYHERNESTAGTVEAIRSSLREGKPIILEFFGKVPIPGQPGKFTYPGHAVLAYKMVDWHEGKYCVYLYDSNYPVSAFTGKAMPNFTFRDDGGWNFPSYMTYTWAMPNWVSAQPLTREMSPELANALVPGVKKAIEDMTSMLNTGNKLIAMLRCPADALITDGQGRRIGMINGEVVNEIPEAEVLCSGFEEAYVLPGGQEYSIELERTDEGDISFDIVRPGNGKVDLATFTNLPIAKDGSAKIGIKANNKITPAETGGQRLAPSIIGTVDGLEVERRDPAQPATTPVTTPAKPVTTEPKPPVVTPPPPAPEPEPAPPVAVVSDNMELKICTNVVDGQPEGIATEFSRLPKIFCWAEYTDLVDNTEVLCEWFSGTNKISERKSTLSGSGWFWFSISTTDPAGFKAGNYSVKISAGGKTLAQKNFVMR